MTAGPRTWLWLPCLAVALLPIPAWGQPAPASPRRDDGRRTLAAVLERVPGSYTSAQAAGLQIRSKLLRLSRPAPGRPCPAGAVSSGREH